MKKKILLLAVALIVISIGSIVIANVPYTVTIAVDDGDNPAIGTWVTFEFGDDHPVAQVNANGIASTLRAAWWYGDWSATIDPSLTPLDPDEYSQTQGGANNQMEWTISGI